MQTITIPKKEYQGIVRRQAKIEQELRAVRKVLRREIDEAEIRPAVLSRWEKISRDLDDGKGLAFSSVSKMRDWLKSL
ncbi:MAG: hypothetical protein HY006_02335 [Candidatus Sungbacteria bacterium]|nr:hypothetical protein [Candidatus Sungbacteria bacterium]